MDTWEEFDALFSGLHRAYGQYTEEKKKGTGPKVKGRAKTITGDLTNLQWESHLAGKSRLGVVPIRDDSTVVFGAIDIDDYTVTPEDMEERAAELGIPVVVTRSKSGGTHMWVFLSTPVDAGYVRQKLHNWAVALGFPSAEVFPKQDVLANRDDVGNWIHVPYCGYESTTTYGILNSRALSPDEFLAHAEKSKLSPADLEAVAVHETEGLEGAPPCLQALARHGIEPGARNSGMFAFAVLAQKRSDATSWEDDAEDMNRRYMSPPLSRSEMTSIYKSLNRKEYFYTCKQRPLASCCNKEQCRKAKYGIAGAPDDPGVQIISITKIDCEPPQYFVQVNGARIEVASADVLLNQLKFQKIVFEKINVATKRVKNERWIDMLNQLMQHADVVEAPEDAGTRGQFKVHLRTFCTRRAQGNSRDEILQGKAWNDNKGWIWFRSYDLLAYLDRAKFRAYTASEVWVVLREHIKCQHTFVNLKGQGVNIWGIPEYTDDQDEDFDLPDIDVGVEF